jgi:hypothetical protein
VYLLRTLSQPHTKEQRVGEQLFPCCGHAIYEVEGQDNVLITGCNSGIDFDVLPAGDEVLVRTEHGLEYRVSAFEWKRAVCGFSDAVEAFYAGSSPKQAADDFERRSFSKFKAEWSRRRMLADAS